MQAIQRPLYYVIVTEHDPSAITTFEPGRYVFSTNFTHAQPVVGQDLELLIGFTNHGSMNTENILNPNGKHIPRQMNIVIPRDYEFVSIGGVVRHDTSPDSNIIVGVLEDTAPGQTISVRVTAIPHTSDFTRIFVGFPSGDPYVIDDNIVAVNEIQARAP